jgi:hypothetical protein
MSVETKAPGNRVTSLRRRLGCYLTCRSKLDLLVSHGRHLGDWFGLGAVSHLTRASRKKIEEGLDELVRERVIHCRRDGATSLCALTADISIRRAVEELPRPTRSERRHLLHHSVRQHGIGDDRQDSQRTLNVMEESMKGATP